MVNRKRSAFGVYLRFTIYDSRPFDVHSARMVDIQGLKSSTDAESEDTSFFTEKEGYSAQCSISPRVRIIRVNQTERHVDDRHLKT